MSEAKKASRAYGQGAGNGNALLATGEVIGVSLRLMPQTHLLSQDAGEKITAWVYIPPVSKQAQLRERYPLVPGGEWCE